MHPVPFGTAMTYEMEVFMITGLLLFAEVCISLAILLGMLVYYLGFTLCPQNRGYSCGHHKPCAAYHRSSTQKNDVDLNVNVEEGADPATLSLSVPHPSSMKTNESVMGGFKRLR